MFISNNRPPFHLWRKEKLVKYQKLLTYYENDCRLRISQVHTQKFFCKLLKVFAVNTNLVNPLGVVMELFLQKCSIIDV